MSKKAHELEIDWEGLFCDSVEDRPVANDYSYFVDKALEGTGYHESSYLCPACGIGERDDGAPIFPLLSKLKINRTHTVCEGNDYIVFNLFTCPNCQRFLASIREYNERELRDEYFMPPALRKYALISSPYDNVTWEQLIRDSSKLTQNPEENAACVIGKTGHNSLSKSSVSSDNDESICERISNIAYASELPMLDRMIGYPLIFTATDDPDEYYVAYDVPGTFVLLDNLNNTGIVHFMKNMMDESMPVQGIAQLRDYISSCVWGDRHPFHHPSTVAQRLIVIYSHILDPNLRDYIYTIRENRYKDQKAECGIKIGDQWHWFSDEDEDLWSILNDLDWKELLKGHRTLVDTMKKWEWDLRGAEKVDSTERILDSMRMLDDLFGD